jgi:hypothetical protein
MFVKVRAFCRDVSEFPFLGIMFNEKAGCNTIDAIRFQ